MDAENIDTIEHWHTCKQQCIVNSEYITLWYLHQIICASSVTITTRISTPLGVKLHIAQPFFHIIKNSNHQEVQML